jgi:prophage maintenance system killer protein
LTGQNTEEILNILSKYSKALTILDEYDRENFKEIKGTKETKYKLTYDDCARVISEVKKKFVEDGEKEIFSQEKDWSFKSVVENLYQTYNSKELYKTTEDKAANLLYLVIKDHSFVGGNKRVASILFAYFLEKTDILYKDNGERKINDSGLVALTLLIAESNPKDKDILVKMIKNLLV